MDAYLIVTLVICGLAVIFFVIGLIGSDDDMFAGASAIALVPLIMAAIAVSLALAGC
jgi:hypothetical protein